MTFTLQQQCWGGPGGAAGTGRWKNFLKIIITTDLGFLDKRKHSEIKKKNEIFFLSKGNIILFCIFFQIIKFYNFTIHVIFVFDKYFLEHSVMIL